MNIYRGEPITFFTALVSVLNVTLPSGPEERLNNSQVFWLSAYLEYRYSGGDIHDKTKVFEAIRQNWFKRNDKSHVNILKFELSRAGWLDPYDKDDPQIRISKKYFQYLDYPPNSELEFKMNLRWQEFEK